jgi:hypothetical protein
MAYGLELHYHVAYNYYNFALKLKHTPGVLCTVGGALVFTST